MFAIAGILLAVLVGAGAGLARFTGDEPTAGPARSTTGAGDRDATGDGATGSGSTGDGATTQNTPIRPEPTKDPDTIALEQLNLLRQQDATRLALDSRYAAQLASKVPGIVDPYQVAANGTNTFRAADILAEHLAARRSVTDAPVVLALSTDFGNRGLYQGQPLWVTLAVLGFPTTESVTGWCQARFANLSGEALRNRCLPKKLDPPRA